MSRYSNRAVKSKYSSHSIQSSVASYVQHASVIQLVKLHFFFSFSLFFQIPKYALVSPCTPVRQCKMMPSGRQLQTILNAKWFCKLKQIAMAACRYQPSAGHQFCDIAVSQSAWNGQYFAQHHCTNMFRLPVLQGSSSKASYAATACKPSSTNLLFLHVQILFLHGHSLLLSTSHFIL